MRRHDAAFGCTVNLPSGPTFLQRVAKAGPVPGPVPAVQVADRPFNRSTFPVSGSTPAVHGDSDRPAPQRRSDLQCRNDASPRMLFGLQAKVVFAERSYSRFHSPDRDITRKAAQAGGIVLRGIVLLAVGALAWVWWQSGRKATSAQSVSASPPVPQKDGTLVIPATDLSGRRAEPMVLVPVSARPTAAPVPAPTPVIAPEPARPSRSSCTRQPAHFDCSRRTPFVRRSMNESSPPKPR